MSLFYFWAEGILKKPFKLLEQTLCTWVTIPEQNPSEYIQIMQVPKHTCKDGTPRWKLPPLTLAYTALLVQFSSRMDHKNASCNLNTRPCYCLQQAWAHPCVSSLCFISPYSSQTHGCQTGKLFMGSLEKDQHEICRKSELPLKHRPCS